MPNWCTNKLEIGGDPNTHAFIRSELSGENGILDFSKIIPIPADLERKGLTDVQKASNKRKYGYSDWYDFCCEKWGTKWNASNVEVHPDGSISFQTAWSPPVPIIKELSKKYPNVSFRITYVDEGGSFIGFTDVVNGETENNEFDVESEESRDIQLDFFGEVVFGDDEPSLISEDKEEKKKKRAKKNVKVTDKPIPKFICRERFANEMLEMLDKEFGNSDLYEQALKTSRNN